MELKGIILLGNTHNVANFMAYSFLNEKVIHRIDLFMRNIHVLANYISI
jgi:hypothetical protein